MIQLVDTAREAVPFLVDPELTPGSVAVALASREERASLLREMLSALDDATPAGQRYLMTKLLALFHREVSRLGDRIDIRQRKVIDRTLGFLRLEAAHLAPDSAAFERSGQMLVDILSLA